MQELKTLDLAEYRKFVRGCIHPGVKAKNLQAYSRLGYRGELGEVVQLLSKALRVVSLDDPLPDEHWQQFVQECGDILHYLIQSDMARETEDDDPDICFIPETCTIERDYTIRKIEYLLQCSALKGWTPDFAVLPNMSIEQLAYINQQKLLARREQIGTFAKD